jgi:hypothetical protein
MWIFVWHIALLAAVAVLAWRVATVEARTVQANATIQKVDRAIERLVRFLDARDSCLRVEAADASRRRGDREKVVDDWMNGQTTSLKTMSVTSAELLRRWSRIEEEVLASNRNTVEIPRREGAPVMTPAPDPALNAAAAVVAAGLGPRPPKSSGTMLSMQAVAEPGSARPSSARSIPRVEAKQSCSMCHDGFVRVGEGGVGRCSACKGSGFVEIEQASSASQ